MFTSRDTSSTPEHARVAAALHGVSADEPIDALTCELSLLDEVKCCEQQQEVAAYLDGELNESATHNFERHLATCEHCRALLADQRRVLAALEGAFGAGTSIGAVELPESYVRVVAARAKADVSAVRTRHERRYAFGLCVALSFTTFIVLGAAASAKVYEHFGIAARALLSLARLGAEAASDFLVGASVLLRAISECLPDELRVTPIVLCGVFCFALALLLRLITSYWREVSHHVRCESRCD